VHSVGRMRTAPFQFSECYQLLSAS
jgi:hypothetical protein